SRSSPPEFPHFAEEAGCVSLTRSAASSERFSCSRNRWVSPTCQALGLAAGRGGDAGLPAASLALSPAPAPSGGALEGIGDPRRLAGRNLVRIVELRTGRRRHRALQQR